MNVSIYQAAAAMNANSRWQEMISENLSAGSVPGFKKQDLSFSAVQAGRMSNSEMLKSGSLIPFVLPNATAFTNFSGGELKPTGVNTHMALEGLGFFEIETSNGLTAFTRDGEFQLNAQSQLVTKNGHLVMGENGPLQLDSKNGEPISISPSGQISQGSDIKGTLKISTFESPNLLTPIGGGLFEVGDASLNASSDGRPGVRMGWLEGSNTSAPAEMSGLITAMRSFEANQRVVQLHDERMGRLITELGNPN